MLSGDGNGYRGGLVPPRLVRSRRFSRLPGESLQTLLWRVRSRTPLRLAVINSDVADRWR